MSGKVIKRLSPAVILVLALILVLGAGITVYGQANRASQSQEFLVFFPDGTDVSILSNMEAKVLEDYGAFALAALSKDQIRALESRGVHVDPLPDRTTIYMRSATFDTRKGEPVLPHGMAARKSNEQGYFLVQFIGPVKAQWVEELESAGVTLHGYIPNYAFIAGMDAAVSRNILSWEKVQWVGDFHPGYRLDPRINPSETKGTYIVEFLDQQETDTVRGLKRVGLEVLDSWSDGVLVRGSGAAAIAAAHLDHVAWIEPFVEPRLLNNVARTVIKADVVHGKTITGDGQVVAITDTGIYLPHEVFSESGKVVAFIDIAGDSGSSDGDGHGHGTHCAGSVLGDAPTYATYNKYDGQGFYARAIAVKVFNNSGYWAGGSNYYGFWKQAYDAGARINSNSWGSNSGGAYGASDSDADRVMWDYPSYLLAVAAGNSGGNGAGTVGSPATAKNVITVGATETSNPENVASFSSRGPTQDNRIKPDVMAPGSYIHSARRGTVDGYVSYQGTSMATPQVAGAAALVREYFENGYYPTGASESGNGFSPSAALVKTVLINGAVEMTGTRSDWNNEGVWPNNAQGWGRIDLDRSLYFDGDTRLIQVWDSPTSLSTGQVWSGTVDLADGTHDLKINIAWTDYYAASGAGITLVNNLDLRVTAPDGTVFRGNNFSGRNPGYSVGGGNADNRNTVEGIHLVPNHSFPGSLPTGTYTVEIIGTNIAQSTQSFALVASGRLGESTEPPPDPDPDPDPDPEEQVAIMGDYNNQLGNLLESHGYTVKRYSASDYSNVIANLETHEVVVLHQVSNASGFNSLLSAAAQHQKGLIFASSYPIGSHGMGVLRSRTSDPSDVWGSYGWGTVYLRVSQAHPIFSGFSTGQIIAIISGGDNDYQTYDGYGGATIGTSYMWWGYSGMVGVKNRSETGGAKHVVMGSFGACQYTNVNHWTANGKQIFVNAVEWARTP